MFNLFYGAQNGEDVDSDGKLYVTTSAQQKIHDVFKYNEPPSSKKGGGDAKKGGGGGDAKKGGGGGDAKQGGGGDAKKGGGGGDAKQGGGGDAKKGGAPAQDKKEKEKEVVVRVPLCCAECEDTIVTMLSQVAGVKAVECDVKKEKVVVKGSAANPGDVLRTCRKLYRNSDFWE